LIVNVNLGINQHFQILFCQARWIRFN